MIAITYSLLNDQFPFEEGKLLKKVSVETKAEIISIKNPVFRKRKLLSHLLTRVLLSDTLALNNAEINYAKDSFGKPYLMNRESIFVSSSQSDNLIISAISNHQIGIDCEIRKTIDIQNYNRILTKDEFNYCFDAATFYEIWTKKEAYSKFIGLGMNIPFSSFSVLSKETKCFFSTFFIENNAIISYATMNPNTKCQLERISENSLLNKIDILADY